jgi:hypothetical protein
MNITHAENPEFQSLNTDELRNIDGGGFWGNVFATWLAIRAVSVMPFRCV